MHGPQTVRRYRRDTGQADPLPGAGGGSSAFEALGACEFDLIVRGLARTVGAQAGLLAASDQTGQAVEVLAAWGDADVLDNLPGSLTDGFVGRALEFERAALEPIDRQNRGPLGLAVLGSRLTHAVGVAVRGPGGLVGALCAAFQAPPADVEATLRLVESHGRLASLCLNEPGMLDGVLAGAEFDGLTGALNYAALRHELDREVARSERHHLRLSCCFIDLDRFKRVNDHHGHLYGSRMLAEVGASLGSGLRSEDTLGRYGGDEFVAILPETNEAAATALAGRLCSAIQATTITGAFGPIGASIGVAQWEPGSSGEQLLEAADRALRAAKTAGGGTVISASALPAPAVKLARSPVNGRVSDTPGRPVIRFCAHCGQRPPADTNADVRVCERCGLGILISAPAGAAPAVGEPFVIVDENLAVRALCKHAEKLLGVSERWAIDRDIDELLTQADTDDPNITDVCAAIARSAQGDVELASVEVRLVNAADAPFRVRIGPCGPPSAALLVLQDAS